MNKTGEVGYVVSVTQSIVWVSGLPGAKLRELVILESGRQGYVISLKPESIEVLVLSRMSPRVGSRVARTGERLAVEVGEWLLGQTVDGLGKPIGRVKLSGTSQKSKKYQLDVTPLGISARKKVSRMLPTGVALVDILVPLGKGQRELVVGDRKTGKTHFLLKTVLTRAGEGEVCVYAAIGKKKSEIKRVEEYFARMKVDKKIILVAASSQDSVGEIYMAPYTAMAIAEYFRDCGRDCLVVLDDMSTHAKFYREIALLGRRFPGRDSYPGDIFYNHSKLLERAGNFIIDGGEAAITCLPVIETASGDFTGYIQTNMMSMTDGHIYFDSDLYFSGRRPAINPFISVTRVGHQTQNKLQRAISQETLNLLNDYEKTQGFVRFGSELGDNSRQILAKGEKVFQFFEQPMDMGMPSSVQAVLWALLWLGAWDGQKGERLVASCETLAKTRSMVDGLAKADSVETLITGVRAKSEELLKLLAG